MFQAPSSSSRSGVVRQPSVRPSATMLVAMIQLTRTQMARVQRFVTMVVIYDLRLTLPGRLLVAFLRLAPRLSAMLTAVVALLGLCAPLVWGLESRVDATTWLWGIPIIPLLALLYVAQLIAKTNTDGSPRPVTYRY